VGSLPFCAFIWMSMARTPSNRPAPRRMMEPSDRSLVAAVDNVAADHPSDAQLVAMARKYFKGHDNMAADPTQV
jgi:uncharacterized protein involved in tellurium resistance